MGKADILQVTLTQVSWDRSWTIGGVFACSVWSENPTLVYGSVQVYGGERFNVDLDSLLRPGIYISVYMYICMHYGRCRIGGSSNATYEIPLLLIHVHTCIYMDIYVRC